MDNGFAKIRLQVDGLTLRERVLIFASGAAVVLVFWNFVFFQPQITNLTRLKTQMQAVEHKLNAQSQELIVLASLIEQGPDSLRKEEFEALGRENTLLEDSLYEQRKTMLSADSLLTILKDVFSRSQMLKIDRIESLPGEKLNLAGYSNSAQQSATDFFRHTVIITLEGSYFELILYLQELEKLPFRLYWESLSYTVENYPQGVIEIKVSTLTGNEAAVEH